ncbi:MAG: YncE family protein, partial [Bacteroidales bacterium]|nr:YncE family protein [Bacteroidales bacterium]
MRFTIILSMFFIIVLSSCNRHEKTIKVLQVPGRDQICKINIEGTTVLPSGRYLTPAGEFIRITNDPYGMTISPNGNTAVTLHDDVITIIDLNSLKAQRIPSYDGKIPSPLSKGSFLGVAFSSDSKNVYLSGGDKGDIIIYDIEKLKTLASISLNGVVNGEDYQDSFTSDLMLNPEKNELLVLDRGNFRMVRIDLNTQKVTASIKVGRQPFGVAMSPDNKQAFVANVGVYSYPLIIGATPENIEDLLIS